MLVALAAVLSLSSCLKVVEDNFSFSKTYETNLDPNDERLAEILSIIKVDSYWEETSSYFGTYENAEKNALTDFSKHAEAIEKDAILEILNDAEWFVIYLNGSYGICAAWACEGKGK